MSLYNEIKIVENKSWFRWHNFEVRSYTYKSGKSKTLVNNTLLFSGSILKCEAFLRLKENKKI